MVKKNEKLHQKRNGLNTILRTVKCTNVQRNIQLLHPLSYTESKASGVDWKTENTRSYRDLQNWYYLAYSVNAHQAL